MDKPYVWGPCPTPGYINSNPDPLTITGLLMWELRQHFQPEQLWLPGLDKMVWVADPNDPDNMDIEKTRIIIEPAELPRREMTGDCPQVLIKREALNSNVLGLMNSSSLSLTEVTAGRKHYGQFVGAWNVIISADSVGLIEMLGWECFSFFTHFERVLQQHYRLSKFHPAQMSEISVSESEGVGYVVVIRIEIGFNNSWVIAAQAPRLKHVHQVPPDKE
jgi:hypothetical protein